MITVYENVIINTGQPHLPDGNLLETTHVKLNVTLPIIIKSGTSIFSQNTTVNGKHSKK